MIRKEFFTPSETEVHKNPESKVEQLISYEKAIWKKTLGVDIDVPPLPEIITPEVQRKLKLFKLGLMYVPNLNLGTLKELQEKGEEAFLTGIQDRYPNWHRFESLSRSESQNHRQFARNIEVFFWSMVKNGNIAFPRLPGTWLAVETIKKPDDNYPYSRTNVSKTLKIDRRFYSDWKEIQEKIRSKSYTLIKQVGLPVSLHNWRRLMRVRMLEAIEWNLLANREDNLWGSSYSREWTNTEKHGGRGIDAPISLGLRNPGGAGAATCTNSQSNAGYRIAIDFEVREEEF